MGSFYRNEEDDDSLTEMESESLMQKINEEKTGITTVIAQAEAEQCQEFCPSSVKHGLLQSQCVAPFHRTSPETLREGARRKKEHSEFGQPLWRSSARKKSLKMEKERQTPIDKPYSSIVSLSNRRFKVSCCSDIYTSVGSPELSSQPESVYIYAESIKGGDTSCSSVSQDWGSLCLYTEVEKTCGVMQDPGSETAKIDSSIEALFGLESSCDGESIRGDCDSDSSCINADWERSFDSDNDSCNLVYSFAEARGKEHNYFFHFKNYSELTWRTLQGVVTHPDRYRIAPFFHEMMKETEHDRNQEKTKINKGFLFHPQRFLQAKNSEYREGQEYSMLRHVQNGSYGDVFSVRDKQTGFTCAAKRIPLSSFSWEEVGTWSRLDSPRVLQLYGAVQEGLNVVLFMDLKTGSLAQFLKARGHFPEDLALYYHCQVLQALEHLHSRKVIHLDVKVDNVLLSKDKRECFLCDFGLSEMLDRTGYSTKTFRGNGLRGTESHMSPEVARGDPRSDKADVWSSCCMLLHMLSGHQPWTRYYTHPLCLKIVSEPAPLWEIPAGCDPLTCDVIRGGLVKEPRERDSAMELLEKSSRALRAVVGGLFDLVQSAMQTPPHPQISSPIPSHNVLTKPPMVLPPVSITTIPSHEELSAPRIQWVSGWRERAAEEDGTDSEDKYEDSNGGMDGTERWMEKYWGLSNEHKLSEDTDEELNHLSEERWREGAAVEKRNEEEADSDEEIESDLGSLRGLGSEDEWEPFHRLQILCGSKRQHSGDDPSSETEEECVPSMMTSLNHINERNSRLTLTCHRSVCISDADLTDKASDWSDDLSSGVFSSYSSLTDERSFNVDWSVSTNQPPSCSFEGLGVDIWVEDVSGDTLRIREKLKVKLGHVAIGISAQISMRAFSLATLDGKLVSPDTEVLESRMWLLCVPAPDNSTNWTWRIRDGKMETQEADGLQSDTCSTLAA
ncbi:hypothetical protein PHYPO_G00004610 [Pangasianodon hypophthalmus]|uniref:Protein kinase domain-containing protein n=1 Tax=Pangasianodon hypophthalmus TaxID=310915 RepID=A0A5N5Q4D5_PANHP|nr:hypothetical protein PHYPO_G00004610 [Pangasianodon hypophthalmus]